MNVMARRRAILGLSCVLLLFLGLIYAYSILMAPLKSQFAWSVSGVTLIFALSMITFTFGNLIAGSLLKRDLHQVAYVVGAALLLGGFTAVSRVDGDSSLYVVYVAYGVVASIGIGIVYNVVIPTVTAWFPDKTGLAQGACLMGFGAGGFLLGPLVTALYSLLDWRLVLAGIGGFFVVVVLGCSRFIRPPDRDAREVLASLLSPAASKGKVDVPRDVDAREMLHDRTFYLLYLFLFCIGSVGMAAAGIGRELPLSIGADDMTAAYITGFINIGSGLGRFFGGGLLDRFGCRRTMFGIGVMGFVAPCVVACSCVVSSLPVQALGCLLSGAAWGAAVVTMPFVTRKAWGLRNMAQNMALVNTYSIWASLVGSWGAGYIASVTGSFALAMAVMAPLGAFGVVVGRALTSGKALQQ